MKREFTAEELETSAAGPKFADVTPAMLFSKTANAMLAMQVRTRNAVRYAELKQQWLYESGQQKRPDSHYE